MSNWRSQVDFYSLFGNYFEISKLTRSDTFQMAEFILYSSETFVVSAWGLIYLIIACLGGVVTNALNLEEDSLQDHTHAHSINDPGHAHHYDDKYFQDHVNDFPSWAFEDHADERMDQSHDRISAYAKTGITMSVNGVSGGARISSETKPKNMNVVYIIKVCWIKKAYQFFVLKAFMDLVFLFMQVTLIFPYNECPNECRFNTLFPGTFHQNHRGPIFEECIPLQIYFIFFF